MIFFLSVKSLTVCENGDVREKGKREEKGVSNSLCESKETSEV